MTGDRKGVECAAVVEENPDDAAEEHNGTEVIRPLGCIFHGQFGTPANGMASVFTFLALSCPYKTNEKPKLQKGLFFSIDQGVLINQMVFSQQCKCLNLSFSRK